MTYQGTPTNHPFLARTESLDTAYSPGGDVLIATAAGTLLFGDLVYLNLGLRADKSLESSLYASRFLGVVVGGTTTNFEASNDSSLIGIAMSAIGEKVVIQTRGMCYVIADAAIKQYAPITAGRTTAGRAIGDQLISYAGTSAGLAIKAGGSALVKAVNVTQTVVAGVAGTVTAANLDQAALSGTTANGKYAVYVFRVAADGTTVTSAKGADADSLAAMLWPTGSAVLPTLGGVIIHPTGTGGFIGGTTALDDATVVPNAEYFNLVRNKYVVGLALEAASAAAAAIKILLA